MSRTRVPQNSASEAYQGRRRFLTDLEAVYRKVVPSRTASASSTQQHRGFVSPSLTFRTSTAWGDGLGARPEPASSLVSESVVTSLSISPMGSTNEISPTHRPALRRYSAFSPSPQTLRYMNERLAAEQARLLRMTSGVREHRIDRRYVVSGRKYNPMYEGTREGASVAMLAQMNVNHIGPPSIGPSTSQKVIQPRTAKVRRGSLVTPSLTPLSAPKSPDEPATAPAEGTIIGEVEDVTNETRAEEPLVSVKTSSRDESTLEGTETVPDTVAAEPCVPSVVVRVISSPPENEKSDSGSTPLPGQPTPPDSADVSGDTMSRAHILTDTECECPALEDCSSLIKEADEALLMRDVDGLESETKPVDRIMVTPSESDSSAKMTVDTAAFITQEKRTIADSVQGKSVTFSNPIIQPKGSKVRRHTRTGVASRLNARPTYTTSHYH